MYPGHAKQAALVAAGSNATGWATRMIIVVDNDIDPSNLSEVWWALGTRTDPEKTIDIIRSTWGTALNPMLSNDQKSKREIEGSIALIVACKPYSRLHEFPPACRTSPEYLAEVKKKWEM
jgi:3-polyprenyl-4-hydroxybenzoate decarboxylase